MSKIGYMALDNQCSVDVRESMDQQLLRLSNNCLPTGGGGGTITFEPVKQTLYELPQGLPVNAPVDATPISPGTPITTSPAPAVLQTTALTTSQQLATTSQAAATGVMEWVKNNPLVAGGGLLLIFLALSKKRKK